MTLSTPEKILKVSLLLKILYRLKVTVGLTLTGFSLFFIYIHVRV